MATVIFVRAEEYILLLCSVLSALCLLSVWSLSVSCFQFSARYSLSINRSPQPRSKHVSEGNCLRGVVPGNHVQVSYARE